MEMNKTFWVIKEKSENEFINAIDGFEGEYYEITESITDATAYDNKEDADMALKELYDSEIYTDWCSDDCEGEWEVVKVEATYKLS